MPEPDQLLDRARGEAVAAHLLARERALLQQRDVEAAVGEVAGGGRTARTGADDDDVGLDGCAGGRTAGSGSDMRRSCSWPGTPSV